METVESNWEYCRIKLVVVHDGKGHSDYSGAPPNYWFQFVAYVQSPRKSYVAAKSEKIPYPSQAILTSDPKPVQSHHQNFLTMLLSTLENDGWESLGQKGASWWEVELRRLEQPQQSWLGKVKSLLNVN